MSIFVKPAPEPKEGWENASEGGVEEYVRSGFHRGSI
jgi:hypothetical protein